MFDFVQSDLYIQYKTTHWWVHRTVSLRSLLTQLNGVEIIRA